MTRPLQILIAEDNPLDVRLLVRTLKQSGFEFAHEVVQTEEDYLGCLHPDLDIILSDFEMPQFGGMRALELLRERGYEIPFIIISGTIGEDLAVSVMKEGATDYLLKDRLARLGPAISQAVAQGRMRKENRKTQDALQESEERFRQLAENIQEVFWLSDTEKQQILYVSPAYEKIWGRSCAELYRSPRTWFDAIHPHDRDRILQSLANNESDGRYDEEYRVIRPDGSVRWIRDTAFPVVDPGGEVGRVAGVARDITDRKQAEEALRESERRFREMLENVEMIAVTLDKEGRVTFCNDYLLKVTRWLREDAIGADWFTKFASCSPEMKEIFFATIDEGTFPPHYEHPIVTREGQLRDIVWNNTILRDAVGNIVGTASLGEDVTERKRAEERIREQAAMLDRSQDAIIVRGFSDRRIRFWSRGAEELYGWTVTEAVGRDIGELLGVDASAADIQESLLTDEDWRGETRPRTKAGKVLIVDTRATLVRDHDGNPKSVLTANTDMTEQKELEARFLRAQRMESIGTLASGVAHDLNNILAPIMMSVPVLRRELTAEQRDGIVTTIEMSAARGAQIVKQVLTFGRGLEGERAPLQVTVLIKEMMKIMRETFPRSIAIKNAIGAKIWPVLGDATQLHQVLLNLCVNARDAISDGGEILVGAKNLDLDASYASMIPEAKPGPHVLLEVTDSGTGMPPEVVERIFDPFFTTKGIGKGTGLGLSTVLGIIRSHGGVIQVHSHPGKGTTFQIYLPAAPDHVEAAEAVSQAPVPEGRSEVILVVDDEESVRASVRMALETGGYRALMACDGIEALSLFATNSGSVALVLTDLMMPSMDGVTLIRALRAMAPTIRIIASTGLGEKAQITQLTTMGVATILQKPFGGDTLLRAIHQTLHPDAESH